MEDEEIKACLAFAGHIPEEKITADVLRRFAGAVVARTVIQCAAICDEPVLIKGSREQTNAYNAGRIDCGIEIRRHFSA